MTPLLPKLIQCFHRAKQVVHYYYVHTDGDDAGGKTSVQNIKRIIERLTQLPVEVYRVTADSPSVRGNFERYADRIVILVRAGQSEEWERFTVVKELCHALMDNEEDYSIDGVETIRELVTTDGWVDDETSPQARSEKLAERLALELVYPLEFRRMDIEKIADEGFAGIGTRRGVPVSWVERALDQEQIATCESLWAVLPPISEPLKGDPVPIAEPFYTASQPPALRAAS